LFPSAFAILDHAVKSQSSLGYITRFPVWNLSKLPQSYRHSNHIASGSVTRTAIGRASAPARDATGIPDHIGVTQPHRYRSGHNRGLPSFRLMEVNMSSPKLALLSAAGLSLALLAAPAYADVIKYKADLSGPQENPPTASKGVGSIEASLDTTTKKLSWSGSYSGLTGPETAAHFHGPAAKGVNAGVMVPVTAKSSPFKGSATLTSEQAKAFAEGNVYFNVHTEQNKGGEIRGQMTPEK